MTDDSPAELETRDSFAGLRPCQTVTVIKPSGGTKQAEFIRVESGGKVGTVVERGENGIEERYTVHPEDLAITDQSK